MSSITDKLARRAKWMATCWLIFGFLELFRMVALIIFAPQISWEWLQSSSVFVRWTDLVLLLSALKGRSYASAPSFGPGFTEWLQTWSGAMVVLSFVAAFALYLRKPWGRTSVLIAGFFGLIHPILGTILSICTLMVFLPARAAVEYRQIARDHEMQSAGRQEL